MGKAKEELSESKRIEIAEGLFKVSERSGNELIGFCPFHHDVETASFNYNFEKDVYYCHTGCGSGDLITLWSKVNNHDKQKGFSLFCKQFGINLSKKAIDTSATSKNSKSVQKNPPKNLKKKSAKFVPDAGDYKQLKDTFDRFPKIPDSWVKKLNETRKWTREAIDLLDLRIQTHYRSKDTGKICEIYKKANRKIAFPIKDDKGKLVNIILYNPSAKQNKMMSWGNGFGTGRLYPSAPLKSGIVHYVEGISDIVCALSQGLNPITHTTKTKIWKEELIFPFKDRDVIVIPDADQPGFKYANFAADNLIRVVSSLKSILWPEYMGQNTDGTWPLKKGQDITDFFAVHNRTLEDFQSLLEDEDFHKIHKSGENMGADPMQFFAYGVNDRKSFKPRLLAEELMNQFKLIYEPDTGYIYRWNKRYWEEINDNHVKRKGLKLLGDESAKSRIEDAFYQVQKLSTIPHGRSVNDKDEWISLKNGLLRLSSIMEEKFDFIPHKKSYYCTWELPFDFNPDSDKKCDRFLQYLDESVQTEAPIMQIQEYAGYCLTRDCRYQKVLLLLGPGSDGKSLLSKVFRQMVGSKNCSTVSFKDLEDQFHRSSLYNKLINFSTEIGSKALESDYFKAISSGDPINAAFKHQNVFEFSPYSKLIFSSNRLPRVLDNSEGFFRRLLLIEFKKQFLEGDPKSDPDLEGKLMKELPEIFHWALAGLKRLWTQKRFTTSEETNDLILDYKLLNNPILCFVEECCNINNEHSETKDDIYINYVKFCGKNQHKPYGRAKFFKELNYNIKGLKPFRPRGAGNKREFMGIELKSEE